uniref:Replication-associated protein n=1 Tax=Canine circovirus TaxID=1194757 RepID=A0A871R315_9CIRC|nr:replication protein [Canine circovirus]
MAQAQVDQRVRDSRRGNPVRRWCFTINNPTPEEEDAVKNLAPDAKYLICGREVGESGTPHLQGFVNLKKTCRMGALKARLGGRGHFEPARGDDCSNKDYCSKGGDILIEAGEVSRQGKRNDLHDAVVKLKETKSLAAVAAAYPETYVKFSRGLRELLLISPEMTTPRTWKTEVEVLCGPPGCGKSRYCMETAPSAYWKPRGKLWDGYDGHQDVIMDDFYGWLPFDDMLRLCDRYPLRVETKGGTMNFVARRVFITSNRLPHEWYNDEIGNKEALYRRLTLIKVWDGGNFIPVPHFMFPHMYNY